MQHHWQFTSLGGFRAARGEQVLTRFSTIKVAALLARLAYVPGRHQSREELIDMLWPDADLDAGRASLRQALASLRRQLEPPGTAWNSVLIANRRDVSLAAASVSTDVGEFERTLRASRRAARPEDEHRLLARVLELYTGDLLPGFYEEWVLGERERLAQEYERARSRQAFLIAQDGAQAPEPPPLSVEEVASLPGQANPFVGLPTQATRFFGREREMDEVRALLHRTDTRLVTLTGPGGSGKTRLAIQAARQAAESGPSHFVPLADITDADLIPDAVSDALGLARPPGSDALPSVVEALAACPRFLLVLDNLEQMAESGALVVARLLARVPGLRCLVTSRQRLELPQECEYPVRPLPVPEAGETPEEMLSFAGVQLFVNRAQLSRPDFQITPRNAKSVAAVCRRLEGMPLALELAAAWAPVLSPAQMEERLAARFDLLVSRRKEVVPRHRALSATISWSYSLLPPELQRFWARLSVFRGGWTVEAAEAVCGEAQALFLLTQLRARSLVVTEDSGDGVRFRMLESLREWAWEQLDAGERAGLARRHRGYFLGHAEAALARYEGPEQAQWLGLLAADHDNLRAALDGCGADPDGADTGLRLVSALWRFWEVRGHLTEGRERIAGALAAAEDAGGAQEQVAQAHNGAGMLALRQGDHAASQRHHTQALALFRAQGHLKGEAATLGNLGVAAVQQGDYAAALSHYEAALARRREIGEAGGIALMLNNLGNLRQEQGDYDAARPLLEECLALRRRAEDAGGTAMTLGNLANVFYLQGDYPAARWLHEEGLALLRELGDKRSTAYGLLNLAVMAFENGDPPGSRLMLVECLPLLVALEDRFAAAYALEAVAHQSRARGQSTLACRLFGAAARLREQTGSPLPPNQQPGYDEALSALRASLGASAFAAAWSQGRALDWLQAIAEALKAH